MRGCGRAARLRAAAAAARRAGWPGAEAAALRAAREVLRGAGEGGGGGEGRAGTPSGGGLCDAGAFRGIAVRLRELAGESAPAAETELLEDLEWVAAAEARAKARLAELEAAAGRVDGWGGGADGRDAAWQALVALGRAHLEVGGLQAALHAYGRAQEFCISIGRQHELNLLRVQASLAGGNYLQALNYVHKAESLPIQERGPDSDTATDPELAIAQLRAMAGVAQMATGKFKKAALSFSEVTADPEALEGSLADVALPGDLAIYSALCALHSLDRSDFARLLVESVPFQAFLDRSPEATSLVHDFHRAQYPAFLAALEAVRGPLLSDYYLSEHAEILLEKIRRRALCQYAQPFLRLRMSAMAQAFKMSETELRDELEGLIVGGHMVARMDTCEGMLLAEAPDTRHVALERALEVGVECERETNTLLLRAGLARHGLVSRLDGRDTLALPGRKHGRDGRDGRDPLHSFADMET